MHLLPKNIVGIAGTCIALACCAFLSLYLYGIKNELQVLLSTDLILPLWLPTVLTYSLGMLVGAVLWHNLLQQENPRLHIKAAVSIYFRSQIAKYIPGNIAQHIGRLYLTSQQQLSATAVIKSQVVENAVLVLMSLILCISLLLSLISNRISLVACMSISLFTAFITVYLGMRAVEIFPVCRTITTLLIGQQNYISILKAMGYAFVVSFLMGIATWLCALQLSKDTPISLAYAVCVFTASWVLGFATPGSPAGIGVREAALIALLQLKIPAENAVLISLALRAITSCGDILCYCTGYILKSSSNTVR